MKASAMSLSPQDLSAIKTLMDDNAETKIRPLIQQVVGAAIDQNNLLIAQQFDALTLQIREGFNEVSENFADVRSDIIELKADVAELKADVVEVKTDIAELKTDMREVKWNLADTVRRSEFLDVRDRVARLEHRSSSN